MQKHVGFVVILVAVSACDGSTPEPNRPPVVVPPLPETSIVVAPPNPDNAIDPSFAFECNRPPCTFRCSLDNVAFAQCTSPQYYAGLSLGEHLFQVTASNTNGTDRTPAAHRWTIVGTCTPETNSELCVRLGFECCETTAADNCSATRTVNCGDCIGDDTCGGGGVPGQCGYCDAECTGRECGDDGCGGSCGPCGPDESCAFGQCEAQPCIIEGVSFTAQEAQCALQVVSNMDCEQCDAVFDSRTCEDALNDSVNCQVGPDCTGCGDGDSRNDGVSCQEIADYSYFGESAAQTLLEFVGANPSCLCVATEPQTTWSCHDNAEWWVDDCDVEGAERRSCDCGCNIAENACATDCICEPTDFQATWTCHDDAEYWLDDCGFERGQRASCILSCDAGGANCQCTDDLVWDVASIRINPTITVNGSPPVADPNCSTQDAEGGYLHFEGPNTSPIIYRVQCDGTLPNGVLLAPGTYDVFVDNYKSNLPEGRIQIAHDYVVNADTAPTWDVASVLVAPTITVNGAALVPHSSCVSMYGDGGYLYFDGPNTDTIVFELQCDGTLEEGIHLTPGTYDIFVGNQRTNLPAGRVQLADDYVINATTTAPVWNAVSVLVDPTITVNGAPLIADVECSSQYGEGGYLHFEGPNTSPIIYRVQCDGTLPNGVLLAPGTYDVFVDNYKSNLPEGRIQIAHDYVVNADTAPTWDVASVLVAPTITVNGAALVPHSSCVSMYGDGGYLYFDGPNTDTIVFELQCDGTLEEGIHLTPGTYDIFVGNQRTNLPAGRVQLADDYVINATTTAPVWNAVSVLVDPTITVNGAPLIADVECSSQYGEGGYLHFEGPHTGSIIYGLQCDGTFSSAVHLAPGTYDVFVDNYKSNLPEGRIQIAHDYVVNADTAPTWDVTSVLVEPTVTVNGAPVVPYNGCESMYGEGGYLYFAGPNTDAIVAELQCDGTLEDGIYLTPGTYDVFVSKDLTNLPPGRIPVWRLCLAGP